MGTGVGGSSRRDFITGSSALGLLAAAGGSAAQELAAQWGALQALRDQPEALWEAVRGQYFIEPGLSYLNTGTYGPTLRAAYEAACRNLFAMGSNYNKAFRTTMMGESVPRFITRVADFLGARPAEVAFTSGTTEAMNYVASGLDLAPGDEVLTTRHEHQGGIYPWLLKARRFGVVVHQIDLPSPPAGPGEILERFAAALTPRTRVMSFCHVQYTDGTILPVRELCALARERGVVTVVDGAQAVGMLDFRIDALGCDFYAASFHKWLTSPYGCGLLYVREDMRERLWPTVVLSYSGWSPVDRNAAPGVTDITYAPNYPPALLKYSSNIEYYGPLYWTVALAMDFQELLGRAQVEARIRALATRLYDGLREVPGVRLHTAADPALRAGLVSFRLPRIGTEELFQELRSRHGMVIRYIHHPGMDLDVNRVSTHVFNMPGEVDAVVAALRELAA